MTDNLPAVVSSLLEAYAAVSQRLTREQHLSFINLLIYQCPATSTLLALSSHLSMVAPVVPKRGLQRGEPGGPSGAYAANEHSGIGSEAAGMMWDGAEQEHSSDQDRHQDGHTASIKEAVVQPIRAEFVAQILAIRVQPGSIDVQKLLPEHLQTRCAENGQRTELVCSLFD